MSKVFCVKLCLFLTFLSIVFFVLNKLDGMDSVVNSNISGGSSKRINNLYSKNKKKDYKSAQPQAKQVKKSGISERNENIRKMFLSRIQRLEKACKQYASYLPKPDFFLPKAYSLEPLEKLAICRTAKHGSTTWAKNFIHIYLG